MEIKVIEIFPKDPKMLNDLERAKANWFINMLRKKYPEELLEKAFKTLEEDLEKSKVKAQGN